MQKRETQEKGGGQTRGGGSAAAGVDQPRGGGASHDPPAKLHVLEEGFVPKRTFQPVMYIKRHVFLGEIANMGGHCVVADARTGRVYAGYHTENFAEIPRDEV